MLEHYGHVRMAAKRTMLDKLESGLMTKTRLRVSRQLGRSIELLRHHPRHNHSLHNPSLSVSP